MRNCWARVARRGLLVAASILAGAAHSAEPVQAAVGDRVRVTLAATVPGGGSESATKPIVGQLLEYDAATLTVARQATGERVLVPRADIRRLEVGRGTSRGKAAAAGAVLGAVVGLGIALAQYKQCQDEYSMCGYEFFLPVITVPVGAAVGTLAGGRTWSPASTPQVAWMVLPAPRGAGLGLALAF